MTIQLTLTQLKQINANGYDIREAVEQINNLPEWARLDSISEIQAIIQSGCAANAHVSCYYHQAKEIFMENSTEIEKALEELLCEPVQWDIQNNTFEMFVSTLLQQAVELKCHELSDILDGVDWD